MKSKKWPFIALFIIIIGLSSRIVLTLFVEPWIGNRLETGLNEKNPNIIVNIEKVHISVISAGICFEGINIDSKNKNEKEVIVNGLIGYVRIKGFNILKYVLTKKINLKNVTISNSSLEGIIPVSIETKPPLIIPSDITINSLVIDETDLHITSAVNSLAYSIKKGAIKVYNLHLIKHDTLSGKIINQIDFKAEEFRYVSADSINSYLLSNPGYSSYSKTFSADSFCISPNYSNYKFASMFEFQKDRIEIILSGISANDFNAADYIRSGILASSSIEIGNMELKVFRDKRKEFRHIDKTTLQDLIYSYPGFLRIDTISVINGNITYSDHAEKANESGYITFNKVKAGIFNITNDTVYMTKKAFLELRCTALLMAKGKIGILLKSRIFDSRNVFSVEGTLSGMEISEMNPFLENSASVYITSGKLNKMDFSFTANNAESNGKMTMLYDGLDLAVKNKRTDDTTAFKERLISIIANIAVLDSNPLPGKEIREGTIKYERDPEKFLFSYCAKSILSGIKSSLLK